jgi:dTDP-glucose pyrophosphorylase
MRHDICVILPCAGEGSRLGLPFPKELAPLGNSRFVIDSCLDLIGGASRNSDIRIILLENGEREQTAEHIRRRLPQVPLAMIRQHKATSDMPEAVLMLEPWLGTANVLLLPDCVYEYTGDPVTEVGNLAVSGGFAFGAVRGNPEGKGALVVDQDDRVALYEDKPARPCEYNAAWCMLGFGNGSFGMDAVRLISYSTARVHEGSVRVPPLHLSPVVWLKDCRDCGTWENYMSELRGDRVL